MTLTVSQPVGSILFRAGDECRGFIRLKAGCIRVSLTSASGREIVLYRVRPGEVCLQTFSCLVEGRRYQAEGAAETAISGEIVPATEFSRRMRDDDGFRQEVLTAVAKRFSDFEHVVEMLAFAGLEQRVAEAILRLAGAGRDVRATHEQIAAEIGSAREAVSRQIAQLVREGLVASHRGELEILDRHAIERLARASV